jgi:arylsulfatase A-like enzyme
MRRRCEASGNPRGTLPPGDGTFASFVATQLQATHSCRHASGRGFPLIAPLSPPSRRRARARWERLIRVRVAALAALGVAFACNAPETSPQPSFLLIVADTLRSDHLHFAGYPEPRTPYLDALRAHSVWFTRAYSTAPWTLPSMTSLFTSQLGSEHGVVMWGSLIGAEQTTLSEVLRAAGYATGAWNANPLLAPSRGLSQGFDTYKLVQHPQRSRSRSPHDEYSFAPARPVLRRARAWLRRQRPPLQPTFVYVHLMEPHSPYRCPPGADPSCQPRFESLNQRLLARDWTFADGDQDFLRARYTDEVAALDHAVGRFLQQLTQDGLLENTWIVFTADHGELLGEHGSYLHPGALYQPLVHVPLLISPPSRRRGRVAAPVSLIDVAPTLLELAGVPAPTSFRGRSLVPALDGEALAQRPAVAEFFRVNALSRHRFAVIDGDQKYLFGVDGGLERFDVADDPGEEHPLPAERGRVDELLAGAGFTLDFTPRSSSASPEITPEMHEHLQALGYVP